MEQSIYIQISFYSQKITIKNEEKQILIKLLIGFFSTIIDKKADKVKADRLCHLWLALCSQGSFTDGELYFRMLPL